MKRYETMVIIDSMVTDQVIQEEIQTIESAITAAGEIIKVDKWGKRKMAYEINRKSHGFYVVFYYNAEKEVVSKIESNFRINDNVIRWLTLANQPMPQDYTAIPEELLAAKDFGADDVDSEEI